VSELIKALLVIGGLVVIIATAWVVIAVANLLKLGGGPGRVERGVADKWWIPWLFEPPVQIRRDHNPGPHDDARGGHHDGGHLDWGLDGGHHSG